MRIANGVRALALVGLALAAPLGTARGASEDTPPGGTVVFSRGGALYAFDVATKTESKIADLPATPTWLEANPAGNLVAVTVPGGPAWWVRGEAALRQADCVGRARPSPNGECVLCQGANGALLIGIKKTLHAELPADLKEVGFLGPEPPDLVGLDATGVVDFARRTADQRRTLAKPGVKSHLLVAPDGSRAVAVFGAGDDARIYSFVLDGEGVPRRIGGPGVPLGWSNDGVWVITLEGDLPQGSDDDESGGGEGLGPSLFDDGTLVAAGGETGWIVAKAKTKSKTNKKKTKTKSPPEPPPPKQRACVVRAVGGESKCWDGYAPLAFAPDDAHVLLTKNGTLYVGRIAGVRPEPPKKLIENVDPVGAWIP